MKIRIGNDFRYNWLILWNEEAESFTDATDKRLTVTVYGRVTELVEGTDYTITGHTIAIDFTPIICNKTGSYNLALQYTKPSDKFIDGDRRSAVDVDAFIIVPKSEQADSLEDITHTSDAVAMFLDVAYKKLGEIEAAEAVRETAEEGRVTAEQQRAIDSAAAVENANDAATYANEQGAYAEEMSAHPPVIIADYWHNWNFTTNQYETTGQYARGDSAVEGALVVQETGQSAVNTMSQKAVTDELVQLAGDMIHTKVGGKNIFNEFDGESGVVINNLGVLVPSSLWYTSPLIEWGVETQAIINKSRSWAQYDEAGNVTSNWYNDSTAMIEQTLTKDALATHFRSSVAILHKDEVMANYGDILLPFEAYHLEITNVGNVPVKTYVSSKELIKEMILSESFMPQSATYTDGLIDSPFNVIWSDGRNGQITLTRNADNLITGLVAVYNGDESITATMTITRNTNNEVTKTEITF